MENKKVTIPYRRQGSFQLQNINHKDMCMDLLMDNGKQILQD